MNDFGTVLDAATVRFERLLPGPIERVWAYLTESDKRAKWLAAGPMDLTPGGRVELTFRNSELSGAWEPAPDKYKDHENGVGFTARILRCEPPRLLSHSWGGNPGEESEVTYELFPRGDEVLLVLTHRRLSSRDGLLSVSGGWHTHLDILRDLLNGEAPKPFWSTHARLESEYERRLGA